MENRMDPMQEPTQEPMQALRLDFRRGTGTPRWVAPAFLAVALAFAGDVGYAFAKNLRLEKKNEAALAKLEPRSFKTAAAPAASPEEIAAARETVQRLSTPWEKLFGALESAANDQVALLAIEPDPKAGTVTISGESKDYLAALTYVLNLSRAEALSRVQLARHEQKNDPQRSVGFSVSATWGKH
jgi:Tfp pilus assembly protein PilN